MAACDCSETGVRAAKQVPQQLSPQQANHLEETTSDAYVLSAVFLLREIYPSVKMIWRMLTHSMSLHSQTYSSMHYLEYGYVQAHCDAISGATHLSSFTWLPRAALFTDNFWKLHLYSIEQIGGKEGAHVFRRTISKKCTHSQQQIPNYRDQVQKQWHIRHQNPSPGTYQ